MTIEESYIEAELDFISYSKELRSPGVLGIFHEGYAVGWAFKVSQAHMDSLDIQRSMVQRSRKSFSMLTQGQSISFSAGAVFQSQDGEMAIQVDSGTPAGFITDGAIDTDRCRYSEIVRNTIERAEGRIHIDRMKYDPGEIRFSLYVQDRAGWKKSSVYECTQLEFVGVLQTGELSTKNAIVNILESGLAGNVESNVVSELEGPKGKSISLTAALDKYGVKYSAAVVSPVLIGAGVLREASRWSESRGCERKYKVFTEYGEYFGRDKPCQGIEETQAVFYENRFGPLASLISKFFDGDLQSQLWASKEAIPLSNEGFRGRAVGAYSIAPPGSAGWVGSVVSYWSKRLSIPHKHQLHFKSEVESAGRTSLKFFECDLDGEIVARYLVSEVVPFDEVGPSSALISKEVADWVKA